ncbi:hypothetical protein GYMLUDRAFT_80889 [Collybiopsis luxurians FD-317 M1]|nr:hypothetical protein GYMLUDRAFT_80889 [Collybiopsis luxurians FD-317 M1]
MCTVERFPPEIFDLFIDQLFSSICDLKNCCLVSKSWLSRSRKHLFRRVFLTSTLLQATTAPMLADVRDEHRASFQRFFCLPEISTLVRGISIVIGKRTMAFEGALPNNILGVSHRSYPVYSFRHLPFQNITFLKFDFVVLTLPETNSTFEDALVGLPQLERLMLDSVRLEGGHFHDGTAIIDDLFASLAARCARLRTLCIQGLTCPLYFIPPDSSWAEIFCDIVENWKLARQPRALSLLALKSLYLDEVEPEEMENIVLPGGHFQTSLLERIFIPAMQVPFLEPYDFLNITHLTLKQARKDDYSTVLNSKIFLPSLKHIQLFVQSLENLVPLLTLAYEIIIFNTANPELDQKEVHIEGPDDLFDAVASTTTIDTQLEMQFKSWMTSDSPLLPVVTFNRGQEELQARFPQSTAAGMFRSGRGDIWWDVNYW